MTRGRHRVVPVRRPLVQPLAGVAVAATMLAGPLLLASVPAGSASPGVPAVAGEVADGAAQAVDLTALRARDEARASRGQARPTALPSVAPEPSAQAPAPAAPAPVVPAEPVPVPAPVVVGTLWATTDINVRSGPTSDTDRIGSLADLDQVGVTGTTADGWTQVVVDGLLGWVKSSYLSPTQPTAEPEVAAVSDAPCSISRSIEANLSSNAQAVYRSVCAAHGDSVSSFGGYRPGDDGDHGSGRAVDIMVNGEAGWEIARFLQANAGDLGISYLIYEQQYWPVGSPAGAWERMEDRGGVTANHFDHVHVSVR